MTIKELSQFTGKTERTVRNWINKAAEKISSVAEKISQSGHGKTQDYNIDEVEKILKCSTLSKDAVSILMENARGKNKMQQIEMNEAFSQMAMSIKALADTVNIQIQAQNTKINNLERLFEEKKRDAKILLPAKCKTPRNKISEIMRSYAVKTGIGYAAAWGELYQEAYYRLNVNLTVCARNRGLSPIEYAEQEGYLSDLLAIAVELFGGE